MDNTTEDQPQINYDFENVEADLAGLASNIQEIRDMDNVLGIPTKPVADAWQAVYDEELEIHQDMLKQMEAAGLLPKQGVDSGGGERGFDSNQQFLEIRGEEGDIQTYVLDFDNPDDISTEMIEAAIAAIEEAEGGFGSRPVVMMFHGWTVTDERVSEAAGETSQWFTENFGDSSLPPIVIIIDWDSSTLAEGLQPGIDNAAEIGDELGRMLDIVDRQSGDSDLIAISHSLGMEAVMQMLDNSSAALDMYLAIQSAVQEGAIREGHPLFDIERVRKLVITSGLDLANLFRGSVPTEVNTEEPGIGFDGITLQFMAQRLGKTVAEFEEEYRSLAMQKLAEDEARIAAGLPPSNMYGNHWFAAALELEEQYRRDLGSSLVLYEDTFWRSLLFHGNIWPGEIPLLGTTIYNELDDFTGD